MCVYTIIGCLSLLQLLLAFVDLAKCQQRSGKIDTVLLSLLLWVSRIFSSTVLLYILWIKLSVPFSVCNICDCAWLWLVIIIAIAVVAVLRAVQGYYKDTVEFFFPSRNWSKNFWKRCIEHHAFFRCHTVKHTTRPKNRVVSRGSSFRSGNSLFDSLFCCHMSRSIHTLLFWSLILKMLATLSKTFCYDLNESKFGELL